LVVVDAVFFSIKKKIVKQNFKKLQMKHQIPFPTLQRMSGGVLNFSNSWLAIVAMPILKCKHKWLLQTF
jgi:hypothetical protein